GIGVIIHSMRRDRYCRAVPTNTVAPTEGNVDEKRIGSKRLSCSRVSKQTSPIQEPPVLLSIPPSRRPIRSCFPASPLHTACPSNRRSRTRRRGGSRCEASRHVNQRKMGSSPCGWALPDLPPPACPLRSDSGWLAPGRRNEWRHPGGSGGSSAPARVHRRCP